MKAYFDKYTSEENLPSWMLLEELTLGGTITNLYKRLDAPIREEIANYYKDAYE